MKTLSEKMSSTPKSYIDWMILLKLGEHDLNSGNQNERSLLYKDFILSDSTMLYTCAQWWLARYLCWSTSLVEAWDIHDHICMYVS